MKAEQNSQRSKLEKEGWTRKFTIESNRVDEYKELYESLDLEVRVEFVNPSEIEECSTCFEVKCDKYIVIYTRPKPEL